MFTIELRCDHCVTVRAFEQPPCQEPHEPTCPEWVCTACGTALLVDPPSAAPLTRSHRLGVTGQGSRRLAA